MKQQGFPYLSDVKIKQNDKILIIIHGHWPTPSWNLVDVVQNVDKLTRTITIRIIGETTGGIALQMLKPFTHEINLEIDAKLNWRLIVQGKGKDFITNI